MSRPAQYHHEDGWFAEIPDLPGRMTRASAFEVLGLMIQDAKRGYIQVSL